MIATGYNGAASGQKHCLDIGCLREELNIPSGERHELCRAVHAEQNVIAQASKRGISSEDATLYCTTFPCFICAKLLVNSGISKIYYEEYYNAPETKEMFEEANIELVHWQGEEDE